MTSSQAKILSIDVRGQVCPSTLLIAMEKMNVHKEALRGGALVLAISTDNRDATNTIPETAANMGYEVRVKKTRGAYQILIGRNLSGIDLP